MALGYRTNGEWPGEAFDEAKGLMPAVNRVITLRNDFWNSCLLPKD
jgi:hypothetical protein